MPLENIPERIHREAVEAMRTSTSLQQFYTSEVFQDFFEPDMDTPTPEVAPEVKTKNNYKQIAKEYDYELTDILLHLFKHQPRIVNIGHFSYDHYSRGRRHFERDQARARGTYSICFRGDVIAVIVCKPHRQISIKRFPDNRGYAHMRYVSGLLQNIVHDLLPAIKVEELK